MSIEVVLEDMVLSILRRDTSKESRPERLRRSCPIDLDSVLNKVAPIAAITLRG
jgi:hypothetical protein